ncbi:MAG: nuclear transport factor 2 family protein [Nakamurella sp.]
MTATSDGSDGSESSDRAARDADQVAGLDDSVDDAGLRSALNTAEDQLRRATLAGDVAVLGLLLDDHIIYTGPDGRQVSKQQDLDAYASGAVEITGYVEEHRTIRVIGRTGLTWVLAEVSGHAGGQRFGARLRYTRTWAYAAGWRVIAAHASFAPHP